MTSDTPAVRFVLVETSHPGNIGAAARAMKTMGLTSLYLVSPARFPNAQATARASGADGILQQARVCATLAEAIEGCTLVLGASARRRSLPWPTVDFRDGAARLLEAAASGEAAVVFGRERSGLSNEEVDLCHCLATIPANPDFASLNLAMAVQVMAYEIRMAQGPARPPLRTADAPATTAGDMEHLYAHLEQVMLGTGFLNPDNPRHLMRRLRRLLNRAQPDQNEVNILRGLLSSMDRLLPDPRGEGTDDS